MPKPPTIKSRKSDLDKLFSRYIRLRDSVNGWGQCITCGRKQRIEEMDAGHYISRRHQSTRYESTNVHSQCRGCNRFRNGALDEYALALKRKYGAEILEHLNRKKQEISKWSMKDYEQAIEYYKEEIEYLEHGLRKCPYCGGKYKNIESHLSQSECG